MNLDYSLIRTTFPGYLIFISLKLIKLNRNLIIQCLTQCLKHVTLNYKSFNIYIHLID